MKGRIGRLTGRRLRQNVTILTMSFFRSAIQIDLVETVCGGLRF